MDAFKTAGGPTELCPMLRGEPIGGVESPMFILGLKVGHDVVEASKSASLSWTWNKLRNEFIRGNGTKFKVPLGSSREDIELARAISYRYLGVDFDRELDINKVEESYRARASAIITMINNLGGGYCDQLSQAVNTVVQGVFIFPARTIRIHRGRVEGARHQGNQAPLQPRQPCEALQDCGRLRRGQARGAR